MAMAFFLQLILPDELGSDESIVPLLLSRKTSAGIVDRSRPHVCSGSMPAGPNTT
jgi:hypothetical protein